MIIENSIKIKNYKCFSESEQGFEKIYPINIIIGKNNTGKSALIDLAAIAIGKNYRMLESGRDGAKSQLIITDVFTEEMKKKAHSFSFGNHIHQQIIRTAAQTNVNKSIKYAITQSGGLVKKILSMDNKELDLNEDDRKILGNSLTEIFNKSRFFRINAERDIRPEKSINELYLDSNGNGLTNMFYQIYYNANYNYKLVDKLLKEVNEIVNPDIVFNSLRPREIYDQLIEIYFEDHLERSIPLSKMGSGLKTILQVIFNLVILPEVENVKSKNLVFGFEELENNLHPSLQRRLFNYIAKYAITNHAYFFITTHSSIVIDLFGQNANAQIIHVENKGELSTVKTTINRSDGKNILKDLDFRQSDILLSNGVIWVEGPSDAIYLHLFLDLYKKDLEMDNINNLAFTIQSLSTAIWKYAGFSDFKWNEVTEELQNQIITLAAVNHNHILVIDNDSNYEDKKPSEWANFTNGTGRNKARLIYESLKSASFEECNLENNYGNSNDNKLFYWITDGTMETYLEYFVANKGKAQFEKYFELNTTRNYFEKKRKGVDSSISKVELAALIAKESINNNYNIGDFTLKGSILYNKIERLFNTIKSWN